MAIDFVRPLGVHGAPHVGDALSLAPIDLSSDKESCVEHLANARTLLRFGELLEGPTQQQLVHDIATLIDKAFTAIAAGRITPQSTRLERAR